MTAIQLNSISGRYEDIKIALKYGRVEITTYVIINALRNKALKIKSESNKSHCGDNLLVREKGFSKPNYHSKTFNENKNKNKNK